MNLNEARTKQMKIDGKEVEAILMAGGPGFKIYSVGDGVLVDAGKKKLHLKENDPDFMRVMKYVNLQYQPADQKEKVKSDFEDLLVEKGLKNVSEVQESLDFWGAPIVEEFDYEFTNWINKNEDLNKKNEIPDVVKDFFLAWDEYSWKKAESLIKNKEVKNWFSKFKTHNQTLYRGVHIHPEMIDRWKKNGFGTNIGDNFKYTESRHSSWSTDKKKAEQFIWMGEEGEYGIVMKATIPGDNVLINIGALPDKVAEELEDSKANVKRMVDEQEVIVKPGSYDVEVVYSCPNTDPGGYCLNKTESEDAKYDASVKGAFDMLTKFKAFIPEAKSDWKKEGYEFHHELSDNGVEIWVKKDGKTVASLQVKKTKDGKNIHAVVVEVDEPHRRKGIATEMYSMAERLMGLKMIPEPAPGFGPSPDAIKLWNQPNRPFGEAKDDWKKEGIEIKEKNDRNKAWSSGSDWIIEAIKDGKVVGYVRVYDLGPNRITSSGTHVNLQFRRMGLATALYQYAEKVSGKTMISADQASEDPQNYSDDAREFWEQPNRPFGESLKMFKDYDEYKKMLSKYIPMDVIDKKDDYIRKRFNLDVSIPDLVKEMEKMESVERDRTMLNEAAGEGSIFGMILFDCCDDVSILHNSHFATDQNDDMTLSKIIAICDDYFAKNPPSLDLVFDKVGELGKSGQRVLFLSDECEEPYMDLFNNLLCAAPYKYKEHKAHVSVTSNVDRFEGKTAKYVVSKDGKTVKEYSFGAKPEVAQESRDGYWSMQFWKQADFKIISESNEGVLAILTPEDKEAIKKFLDSNEDLPEALYEKLFHYYADSGEMPYGTQKARTGDPHEWILHTLEYELGKKMFESGYKFDPKDFPNASDLNKMILDF